MLESRVGLTAIRQEVSLHRLIGATGKNPKGERADGIKGLEMQLRLERRSESRSTKAKD